ncbi:uncharacterized protein LOC127529856 [Erpetoichthys calabaricus]|uniref:uncharacterized protein LOC127529856 n=1 Tax=Erpetoichthys calabaricus TaxID=27687 RepID=UPI0022349C72|nr:uncharacterized protein LOC127529856 [Erpetoichthys calabaricus]
MEKWLKRIAKTTSPPPVDCDEKTEDVLINDKSGTEADFQAPSTNSHESKRRKVKIMKMLYMLFFLWHLAQSSQHGGLTVLCQPNVQKTEVNRTVRLCCHMKKESSSEVTWIRWVKDDILLINEWIIHEEKNPEHTLRFRQSAENDKFCLEIANVQKSDSGIYVCTVFSDWHQETGAINLKVTESLVLHDRNGCRARGKSIPFLTSLLEYNKCSLYQYVNSLPKSSFLLHH